MRFIPLLLSALSCAGTLSADTLFEDGFEAGLGWTVTTTNDGRAAVSTEQGPATGAAHLILDDAVSDALNSVAEAAFTVDLANKRNVVLNFKAKSLGNEPHEVTAGNFTTTRNYDGVAVSANGGVSWVAVRSLATTGTDWTGYSVPLDSMVTAAGWTYGDGFRIRFSGYDNSSAPLDGIAIDDASVTGDDDQRVLIEAASTVTEGSGIKTGYVLLSLAPEEPLILDLAVSPAGLLSTPVTVTVPAGATFTTFEYSAPEDELVTLTRSAVLSLSAAGVLASPFTMTVLDNDTPVATLSIPAILNEGETPSNNATLTLDRAPSVPLVITLSSSVSGELTFPSSITIPAGLTQVTFTVRAVNDTRLDGDLAVNLRATANGLVTVTAPTTTRDNDVKAMTLTVLASLTEGFGSIGTVTINGTLAADLRITLGNSNPAALNIPAAVTIPAGQTEVSFQFNAPNNSLRDGTRVAVLSTSADNWPGASRSIAVMDNDAASFRITILASPLDPAIPMALSVTRLDIEGNVIPAIGTGTLGLTLELLLPDGSLQSLTPATATLTGSTWSGTVTLPPVIGSPLRIKVSGSDGTISFSEPVDLMREMALTTEDLAWDAGRNRLYACIRSTTPGPYANKVVAIDPLSLQVVAEVAVNSDPDILELSPGGEALYVGLRSNGTVAKIDPDTMTVVSTFALNQGTPGVTYYASDFCPVAGQPDLVIISRSTFSDFDNNVAVFNAGVKLPDITVNSRPNHVIEPSADPTVYFGFNNRSSEEGFRQLKLTATGISEIVTHENLLINSSRREDLRSVGNKVYCSNGLALDGADLRLTGDFRARGPLFPDEAANRVYIVEPASAGSNSDYNKISAFDPQTCSLVDRITFPATTTAVTSFMRWGSTGLLFSSTGKIHFFNSSRLVPNAPPADLAVNVKTPAATVAAGATVTYTVELTNKGPNPAKLPVAVATLSSGQTIQSAVSATGQAVVTGSTVTFTSEDLPSGTTATLTVTCLTQGSGNVSCSAAANAMSVDADYRNNRDFAIMTTGFDPAFGKVNQLKLPATSILHDATRKTLWVAISAVDDAGLGKAIVPVDPATGATGSPIFLEANPYTKSLAISANGRYLYAGSADAPEVLRVDLQASPPAVLHVPLRLPSGLLKGFASDIEVLAGDGTGFLVVDSSAGPVRAFDGSIPRGTGPSGTGVPSIGRRIEPTSDPAVFLAHNPGGGDPLSRLSVGAGGVVKLAGATAASLGGDDFVVAGGQVLTSSGQRMSATALTTITALGLSGRPVLDAAYQRAYLVNSDGIRQYHMGTGAFLASLPLPAPGSGDWAHSALRWGADGMAVLGKTAELYIGRWPVVTPAGADANADGIEDAWAAKYYGRIDVDPAEDGDHDGISAAFEYLYGSSPASASSSPLTVSATATGANDTIRLVFRRRAGLSVEPYRIEASDLAAEWTPATVTSETILSTQTVDGIALETVEALIASPGTGRGFVRLKWLNP